MLDLEGEWEHCAITPLPLLQSPSVHHSRRAQTWGMTWGAPQITLYSMWLAPRMHGPQTRPHLVIAQPIFISLTPILKKELPAPPPRGMRYTSRALYFYRASKKNMTMKDPFEGPSLKYTADRIHKQLLNSCRVSVVYILVCIKFRYHSSFLKVWFWIMLLTDWI